MHAPSRSRFGMSTPTVLAWILVLGTILLATLGKAFIDIPEVVNASAHRQRSLDLVLFNGFVHPKVWWAPWTNTLGNIALFLPVGLLVGPRLGRALAVGAALSLGIEITQYLMAWGYTDLDDLVFNTLGAALGRVWARRAHPRRVRAVLISGGAALCTLGLWRLLF